MNPARILLKYPSLLRPCSVLARAVGTQADIQAILHPEQQDASHTVPQNPMDSAFPVKFPEDADARMTSAGILLPKDSREVKNLDVNPNSEGASKKSSSSRSTSASKSRTGFGAMKAWQITQFGDVTGMKLVEDVRVPALTDPFDMLVEIHAASVNPFDVERTRGYGENLIQYMRTAANFSWVPQNPFARKESPFPLTLGRDFSGMIVDVGKRVKHLKAGDEVFGVIGPHRQGTFAEYAATSNWCVARKPKSVSHTDAASLPYVACTAWSVLKLIDNLPASTEKRVLIIGASGGVGSFSVQYLKSLPNVHVTAVCGTSAIDLMASLGADDVIDYVSSDVESELRTRMKFDVIFQASGGDYEFAKNYLKGNLKSFYVTLTYPLLKNVDKYGSIAGVAKSAADYSVEYAKGLVNGNHTIWAFFAPNGRFLEETTNLVEMGRIRPVVDKVYPLKDLPTAFQQVDSGDTKGKVIVQIKE